MDLGGVASGSLLDRGIALAIEATLESDPLSATLKLGSSE